MSYTSKITETLKKKIGPLETWQWGAAGVAGFVLYRMVSGGGGSSAALTPGEAGLPSSDSGASSGVLPSVAPGAVFLPPVPIDPFVAAPLPAAQPAPVLFPSPEPASSPVASAQPVAFAPLVAPAAPPPPEQQPTTSQTPPHEQTATDGGISSVYIPPILTTPATVAGGGPTFIAPTTNRAFQSPFQGPFISSIVDVAKSSIRGLAQPGSQIQEVGGVPISLSAAAIARGGIPARDVPLSPAPAQSPIVTVPASSVPQHFRVVGGEEL